MPVPDFSPGEVLTAAAMDSIGLWLVKTQTVGTGVSSVNVTGAFSADYEDYLITWSGTQSADTNILMYLGNTLPANGYWLSMIFANPAAVGVTNAGVTNGTSWSWSGGGSSSGSNLYVVLKNPFLTRETFMTAQIRYSTVYGTSTAYHANTSSWTSFTVAPASGTMTGGTIRVYGYRK